MKLLQVTFPKEFADAVEAIFQQHQARDYVRRSTAKERPENEEAPMPFHEEIEIQAEVEDSRMDPLLEDLKAFQKEKSSREAFEVSVLEVEDQL